MCGIAGFVARPNEGRTSVLHAMADAIAHRGPDGAGFFFDQLSEWAVGLAHRRLAIIDVETGTQPMTNEIGSVRLVFNGEIYNFRELRNELAGLGHCFKSSSDTEVIVHAYEQWGTSCVERLRGMFAFALWDAPRERLFLARDRFGKKPLFIHENAAGLFFASEIKSILTTGCVSSELDTLAITPYLAHRYVPGPATLFRGIAKLEPGCIAVWEQGRLERNRYYVPLDARSAATSDKDTTAEEFLEQLDEAVRLRLVSDVPFGAFLSGGIDSSAIVALMSRHCRQVRTFSVGFSASAYSELKYARAVASYFNTSHHELVVDESDIIDNLRRLTRSRDAPVAEPSDIPIYLLSAEANRHVKMVLTGEGSDEVLGGYPKHVYERFAPLYHLVPSSVRSRLIAPLISLLPYRYRRIKTAESALRIERFDSRMARWFGCDVAGLRPGPVTMGGGEVEVQRSSLKAILGFDQTSWLPDNLLERGDRMTMAASIEARMPFLDHTFVEYVSSLADRYRVRGRKTKWILREAMKLLLPSEILSRPKVGFRVPVNDWFRGHMKGFLCDHLLGADSRSSRYFDQVVLRKVVADHLEGRQNHEKLLWTLLTLEMWQREYGVS